MPLPALNLLVATVMVAAANQGFWKALLALQPTPAFLAAVGTCILVLVYLFLAAVTWGRLAKPALYLVLLTTAATTYFISRYGVVIDRDMIANVIETDTREALELFNPGFLTWMLAFGLLPCVAVSRVHIVGRPWKARVGHSAVVLLASVLILGTAAAAFYQPFASLLRNHRELRYVLVPLNVVSATLQYARRSARRPQQLELVGVDAHRVISAGAGTRRRVTVVVVGETARAQNFSLLGYERETNPELAQRDLIVLGDTRACGTATATSVPCMFQDVGQAGYRSSMATGRENLLDVLRRAGIDVFWSENNAGCKHVCDRVPHEELAHLDVASLCPGRQCRDEVLLRGLQARIDAFDRDGVIVLHMLGSHGPAYFKRYPRAFAVYRPECRTAELERCTREQIVNAYDNTIRYTDHVLSALVDLLERNGSALDIALLYVSDHGESLGEHGLYLHGMPYAIAPAEQTRVPMLMWLSPGHRERIDVDCMRRRAHLPTSHDNLYHSVLGLMRVQASVYRRERDLFAPCMRMAS